jgi:phosphoribosylglycinamide formyltransferase-1
VIFPLGSNWFNRMATTLSSSTPRKRIVVLISGTGTLLGRLISEIKAGKIHGDIVSVISNRPDVLGLKRAKEAGIETHLLDHTLFKQREEFDTALQALIETASPDLVVLAGFMRILTPQFVLAFKERMLNIHPSLLPAYPGLNTHQSVLEAGDREHGCSVHFVNEITDGGPLVIQARVPVYPDDTPEVLRLRVLEQEHQVYPMAVRWFCADRLRCVAHTVYFDRMPLVSPFQFGGTSPCLPEVI